MNSISLTSAGISLDPDAAISFTGGQGLCVRCRSGLLWMTVEADGTDYWLKPGECAEIASAGRVVIEAAEKSELVMSPAVRPRRHRPHGRTNYNT